MFCILLVVLFAFFLACYIAVESIVSICLVCDSSIVATYPSVPAARFAFRLSFIRFVLLFVVVLSGDPKQKQGRGYVDRKLVQAPSNFFAGSLLFWFFGDFRYGALLFMIVYTLTEIFYFDLQMVRIITVFFVPSVFSMCPNCQSMSDYLELAILNQ